MGLSSTTEYYYWLPSMITHTTSRMFAGAFLRDYHSSLSGTLPDVLALAKRLTTGHSYETRGARPSCTFGTRGSCICTRGATRCDARPTTREWNAAISGGYPAVCKLVAQAVSGYPSIDLQSSRETALSNSSTRAVRPSACLQQCFNNEHCHRHCHGKR